MTRLDELNKISLLELCHEALKQTDESNFYFETGIITARCMEEDLTKEAELLWFWGHMEMRPEIVNVIQRIVGKLNRKEDSK